MQQILEHVENIRREISPNIALKRKSELGQFMTPMPVARYMASLFKENGIQACRLLDAGAGIGSLTCAFLDRWATGNLNFSRVDSFSYEIDPILCSYLEKTLACYTNSLNMKYEVIGGDFIELAAEIVEQGKGNYTHAILNPPYKKIKSDTQHRTTLRRVGIETVNLYSAFVSLALSMMDVGGQIVAIIPRSFCNGPYYRPFRDSILKNSAIRHIHLFGSRTTAFKDDDVLQENVIIVLERGVTQGDVAISTSTDDTFDDIDTNTYPFDRIVLKGDSERFFHIPTSQSLNAIELSTAVCHTLSDLNIKVSTGPVVDFRMKAHLCGSPEVGAVPLLYPIHFAGQTTQWPIIDSKKPNAIKHNSETEKWLYPNGFYCVVRRFSSKEEKRRVIASVVDPRVLGDFKFIGLENHLNVFHQNKHGLPETLAKGLSVFLNTTAVDENFRKFNGHTQVNATDLKLMKYPSLNALMSLGEWAMNINSELTQIMIDHQFENLIHE